MTARERYLETMRFGHPDRIPLNPGGPRESTRRVWAQQGLADPNDWWMAFHRELGIEVEETRPKVGPGVSFRMIPEYEEKVIEHRPGTGGAPGHLVVQDWMGNVVEISDEFDVTYMRQAKDFVTRRWHKFPVENEADFEEMKKRYDLDDPARFPDDWEDRKRAMAERDYVTTQSFSGPFWQLREWCGFEPLCILFATEPEFVKAMISFWTDFVCKVLEKELEGGSIDRLFIQEDMAYKAHPMISPEMTREFIAPSYRRWVELARANDVEIVEVDSDGNVDLLVPIWIDCGMDACSPIEVAAGCDINAYRDRYGEQIAFVGGVDKRAMAKGGKIIEAELERIAPVVKSGGYIPSCDHGIPSDVSWPDFLKYVKRLAELTGWL
ncbi:MAG: uroporphyrinogen decarboxylase family protein, partial [Candidatus Sumerlaeota bacterium]